MSRIQSKNTKPEVIVRSMLHHLGYRFRIHRRDLPGTPDIVLPKYNSIIFVHGCFWHRHPECPYAYMPKSRIKFWEKKFLDTVNRDTHTIETLKKMGWKVLVVWECELKNPESVIEKLESFLN
jgi:DNA mismatch endonuclease (patch repair protein)